MTGQSKEPLEQELLYSPVLVTKNGKYYFHIRELSLVSKGDSLESAYKNLLKIQEEKINSLKEIDGIENLPAPQSKQPNQIETLLKSNYKIRLIAEFLRFTVIALIFAFAFQYAARGIILDVKRVVNMELVAAKKKIKAHILEPEKVERNNNTLRQGIKNYRPVIEDFLIILEDNKQSIRQSDSSKTSE